MHLKTTFLAAALVAGLATPALATKPAAAPAKLDHATAEKIVKGFYAAANAHKYDDFGKYVAANGIDHNPEPGQKPGLEGLKGIFKEFHKTFPDMKLDAQSFTVEGDKVAVRILCTGTQKGPFMGHPSKGKAFKIQGFDYLVIKDGKLQERWGAWDNMTMAGQLGLLPEPPKPAKKK